MKHRSTKGRKTPLRIVSRRHWNYNGGKPPRRIAMSHTPVCQEVKSKVYRPGLWLAFLVGAFFASAGCVGFFTVKLPAAPWVSKSFAGIFILLGGVVLAWAIRGIIFPVSIRHAGSDSLPNIPREPVITEGSVVYGRLTHELCETAQGWEFRPAKNILRYNKWLFFGFGIPFLIIFSGLVTWVFHSQLNIAGWLVSAMCGILLTALCGGSALALIALLMRAGYRRLSKLTIPRGGNDLELDSAETPDFENADLATGLKWIFIGETKRRRLNIPRELVAAVQLCPWKFVVAGPRGKDISWAVQGLLVLASPDTTAYHRLPILLTADFVGAAKLMQQLAHTIQVPYLFCADATGWKAEEIRAKNRPPLHAGGTQT
jgi:hypothetical protein